MPGNRLRGFFLSPCTCIHMCMYLHAAVDRAAADWADGLCHHGAGVWGVVKVCDGWKGFCLITCQVSSPASC